MIDPNYLGREQTLVKHEALRAYLQRFAFIVGSYWKTLVYVDCFSGPWNVRSNDLSDSSFSIAIQELRKARDYHHEKSGRELTLRCFFVEREKDAFDQLRAFLDDQKDVIADARNCEFEKAIPEIQRFISDAGRDAFPFFFIDPTGWTGFGMNTIAPLLSAKPSEVLVNFMTGHIRRFLESPQEQTRESMEDLFGSGDFRERLMGLEGQDREDAAIFAYAENLKRRCGFDHACVAVVLKPGEDTAHFHLIYATRNVKGAEVFKAAEKKAMEVGEAARADEEARRAGSGFLFSSEEMGSSRHYTELRERYLGVAREAVLASLSHGQPVQFDALRAITFGYPLVWESDLKDWVARWETDGLVEIVAKAPRQRVPKPEQFLLWKGTGAGTS